MNARTNQEQLRRDRMIALAVLFIVGALLAWMFWLGALGGVQLHEIGPPMMP